MLLLPRPDLRSLVPIVLAGALVAPAFRPAHAQDGGTGSDVDLGNSTIDLTLRLPNDDGEFEDVTNPEDVRIREFMNLAACSCDEEFQVEFALTPFNRNVPAANEQVDFWAGTSCASDREDQRELCFEEGNAQVEELNELDVSVPVRHLVGPVDTSQSCTRRDKQSRQVYGIIDPDQNGFDEGDYETHIDIETDTSPPPAPEDIVAQGREESVSVEWSSDDDDDIRYYQLLCARVDDPSNTEEFGDVDQLYLTSQQLCGRDDDLVCPRRSSSARVVAGPGADAGADAGTEGDAGTDGGTGGSDEPEGECVADLPPGSGLDTLDPRHLCGTADVGAGSVTADGLQNGVTYRVVLLIIDEARNVTAIDAGEATPRPVQDFWEDYKSKGGSAEGGCSVGEAGAGAGVLVAIAIAAFALRRRKRRGGGPGAGAAAGGALLLLLSLAPRLADAQPWWEEYDEPVQEHVGPPAPRWGLELKLGPYVPDVDSEFGGDEQGPFEMMFGDGPYLMSQLTLDHYLLYPLGGQLGVSVTAGFLSRSANAYEVDADGNVIINEESGRPERAVGDTTTFRLWPTSLGVVYRYTQIDDQLGIPIVPYGRAGLSYYYWWVSKPGGGVAVVDGDKARGGSLGWQATGGLAIRAERIDRDAEVSLRNELGIDHAGLVFEFTYAKVDGFGTDTKLSVGDATFFGGINFEF